LIQAAASYGLIRTHIPSQPATSSNYPSTLHSHIRELPNPFHRQTTIDVRTNHTFLLLQSCSLAHSCRQSLLRQTFCTDRHASKHAMTYGLSRVHSPYRVRQKKLRVRVPARVGRNNRRSRNLSTRRCIPHRCGQTRAFRRSPRTSSCASRVRSVRRIVCTPSFSPRTHPMPSSARSHTRTRKPARCAAMLGRGLRVPGARGFVRPSDPRSTNHR
jgi:hypothetical protein